MTNKDDCIWLRNGVYIDTQKEKFYSPVSGNIGLKSCCRIGALPKEFGNNDVLPFEKWQQNLKNVNYNYEQLKESSCKKCKQEEDMHGYSMRTRSNTGKISNKLSNLQITFSSFCNLKCKYCGPISSTSWNDDVPFSNGTMKLGLSKADTFNHEKSVIDLCNALDLSELRQIGIFGGEPFMARHFEDFLQLIVNKANPNVISLQINTNGSIFPKQKIIDLLKQFGRVDLRLSNESVGKLSEYIRNGLSWDKFQHNTAKWQECSVETSINVRIHAAHTVWSINKANDFYSWLKENELQEVNAFTSNPLYANIQNVLTNEQRKELNEELTQIMPHSKMKLYIQNILCYNDNTNQHEKALQEFKQFTKLFDPRTPYTLKEVNPQLYYWTHG